MRLPMIRVALGIALLFLPLPMPLKAQPSQAQPPPVLAPQSAARSDFEKAPPVMRPPPVDVSRHSVPLDDVVFDTFDGGMLLLSEATPERIEGLRDAIRPIHQPRYDGPAGGDWMGAADLVIGYASRSGAYAYPLKMLNYHEIVNDVIDGVPVLISYCPLCASGVVYDRRLDGKTLSFGNTSALYENDMVMYDHQTGSYWFQVAGEAIVGALTGKRLDPLPSATMPWGRWRALYPGTRVLSRQQGFARRYSYTLDSFQHYPQAVAALRFPFPFSREKLDRRLPPATVVLSVRVKEEEKAYPISLLGYRVVNDTIAGQPVVVFAEGPLAVGTAFSAAVRGRPLTFQRVAGDIRDRQTDSRWNLRGEAVAGALKGERLRPLPSRRAFWFALSLAVPGIAVFQP